MASSPIKLTYALLLLCITSQGMSQTCIQVDQQHTRRSRGFDSEFKVEIKNVCNCAQGDVRMFAQGFASEPPVNPAVFRRDGNSYLVNGGNPIRPGASVKFSYWWSHYTDISLAVSRAICS